MPQVKRSARQPKWKSHEFYFGLSGARTTIHLIFIQLRCAEVMKKEYRVLLPPSTRSYAKMNDESRAPEEGESRHLGSRQSINNEQLSRREEGSYWEGMQLHALATFTTPQTAYRFLLCPLFIRMCLDISNAERLKKKPSRCRLGPLLFYTVTRPTLARIGVWLYFFGSFPYNILPRLDRAVRDCIPSLTNSLHSVVVRRTTPRQAKLADPAS